MVYLAAYWIVCLGFWWILVGRALSRRYAFLSAKNRESHYSSIAKRASSSHADEERESDKVERYTIVFLVLFDFVFAPLFVPIDLIRRGVSGLYDHYVSIK